MSKNQGSIEQSKPGTAWIHGEGQYDLVSIVIPTFNRSGMLIELLENLHQQTWKSLQIIVVDDGSTDDTAVQVNAWKSSHQDTELLYLHKSQAGPSSARNEGIRHSRGEFIYFIDSDDLIFPDALASMIDAIRQSKREFCVASICAANRQGVPLSPPKLHEPLLSEDIFFRNGWSTHCGLFSRTAIRNAGPYNESLHLGEDSEMNWRIVTVTGQPIVLRQLIGVRREHDLGHLGHGTSQADRDVAALKSIKAYMKWSEESSFQMASVSRGLLRYASALAIKFGLRSDWNSRDEALELLAAAKKHFPWRSAISATLLSPKFRTLFVFFDACLMLRRTLNRPRKPTGLPSKSDTV
jgi:glycosyltransferase involved in cell wall biosynthesis